MAVTSGVGNPDHCGNALGSELDPTGAGEIDVVGSSGAIVLDRVVFNLGALAITNGNDSGLGVVLNHIAGDGIFLCRIKAQPRTEVVDD